MEKVKNILFTFTLTINTLLVFLLLFENRIVLPVWLQVAGRMHPMILHFPIVLIVLYVLWVVFFQTKISPAETARNIGDWLILFSALASGLTALMGLFLSREEGYDPDALLWHKWSGVAVSLFMLLWSAFRNNLSRSKTGTIAAAVFSFATIIFTGHQGAGITHGQNFLLAPILPEKKEQQVLLEDAVVYTHMVQPIIEAKCMSCHNSKKAKGELIMETEELLLKGGKNGKLWDSTESDFGLMMKRIHLPLEAKKHMPPQGKPQLTEDEITVLGEWIKTGADFKIKVLELGTTSDLRKIADRQFSTIETDEYDFDAADNSRVQSLNNNYRIVYPLAKNSPALGAEFFSASQFNSQSLKELLSVKDQLVTLNLDKMQVKDEDLKTIGQFKQLRKLNLSFTGITGANFDELKNLKELRQLAVSGTAIKADALKNLSSLQQLTKLYAWNTGLTEVAIKELQKENANLLVETGFRGDTIRLKLTPPILVNEEQVITQPEKLRLKHYINGVTIRYTLDGKEPDSLLSPAYNNDVTLTSNVQLRARAFKQGWHTSDSLEAFFYRANYRPDSLIHLLPPDKNYKDEKNKVLIDLVKGENNFRTGKWVGFQNNRMEALLVFNQSPQVSSVTVGNLVDTGSHLMPPQSIEVWGGKERNQMKLLKRITPVQPGKFTKAKEYEKAYEVKFNPIAVRYLK
ncbi:MAG: chitobiase/beta-hexosaminidase C-terminal domain-containing protein, partial [Flavisolibacter sp.]